MVVQSMFDTANRDLGHDLIITGMGVAFIPPQFRL